MDLGNAWNIIIGIATVFSLLLYWTERTYYSPIIKMQNEINKKVRFDLINKLKNYENQMKRYGEEEYVEYISNIVYMKTLVRESREIFNHKLVPFSMGLIVLSIIFVNSYSFLLEFKYSPIVFLLYFYFIFFLATTIYSNFMELKKNNDILSKYNAGENPNKILK